MLSSMLKEHQIKQIKKRDEIGEWIEWGNSSQNRNFFPCFSTEQKRNVAMANSAKFTSKLVHNLNEGLALILKENCFQYFLVSSVARAYVNQRKLDAESKQLVANIDHFSRSMNQWTNLMNNFNDSLKQLGDVENWAKVIEKDMNDVATVLESVYNESDPSNPTAINAETSNISWVFFRAPLHIPSNKHSLITLTLFEKFFILKNPTWILS